ncbi:hypothetical protein [Actinomadura sp. 6N118]|uniref:hypothetical protein n=1 Tax=Actinomadura sp. 6N118 TaxID=3375151 RepID=UPI0037A8B8B6
MLRYFAATSVLAMSMAGALIGAAPATATTISQDPRPSHNSHESDPNPHKSKKSKKSNNSNKSKKSNKNSKFKGSIKNHKKHDNDKFSNKSIHYCIVYVLSVDSDSPFKTLCTNRHWQENEGDESDIGGG